MKNIFITCTSRYSFNEDKGLTLLHMTYIHLYVLSHVITSLVTLKHSETSARDNEMTKTSCLALFKVVVWQKKSPEGAVRVFSLPEFHFCLQKIDYCKPSLY